MNFRISRNVQRRERVTLGRHQGNEEHRMLVTACKHLAHTLETDQMWPKLHESKNTAQSDGAKDPCLHQGAIHTHSVDQSNA